MFIQNTIAGSSLETFYQSNILSHTRKQGMQIAEAHAVYSPEGKITGWNLVPLSLPKPLSPKKLKTAGQKMRSWREIRTDACTGAEWHGKAVAL